ncbi:MAG TPA: tetraacyldisaccharide 4'-kinase [Woeseiaceae bacterium]|jgi:tetraacyldisaccharide 4'-kinase|nr:tetraacyldisaccharide 4'-kinase [Woeseiaceae bacterium]
MIAAAMQSGSRFFDRVWYGMSVWQRILMPLSWLFAKLTEARRRLYRSGVLKSRNAPVPVVVVGNITAGGTGKTPATLWLADSLKVRGLKPGIVSRGYGGRVGRFPLHVMDTSDARTVGDEPLLLARRIVCPVAVHPDRVAAASLLAEMGCDVVIADDGLQHYRLNRQFEIAVVDAARGFGNGRLLPAGPLREPVSRLEEVDRVLLKDQDRSPVPAELGAGSAGVTPFRLEAGAVQSLHGGRKLAIEEFDGQTVHAVAGIGNPESFFDLLRGHGLRVVPHAFGDHARFSASDLDFGDEGPIIMTEKDAVRCERVAPHNSWYVTVDVAVEDSTDLAWLDDLARRLRESGGPRP